MARWEIKNVNIAGVAMAVPEHTVKTADIDLFTQEEAEVFDNTVGIKSRHIAPDTMCASDMCQAAGEKLIALLPDALCRDDQKRQYNNPDQRQLPAHGEQCHQCCHNRRSI